MFRPHRVALVLCLAGLVLAAPPAPARVIRTLPGGAGTVVSLPYNVQDSQGNQWMIYQGGYIQMQGGQPLYGQAGTLQINGNGPNQRSNQARLDDKTGEVVFDNMTSQGFTVTRRILIDKENA